MSTDNPHSPEVLGITDAVIRRISAVRTDLAAGNEELLPIAEVVLQGDEYAPRIVEQALIGMGTDEFFTLTSRSLDISVTKLLETVDLPSVIAAQLSQMPADEAAGFLRQELGKKEYQKVLAEAASGGIVSSAENDTDLDKQQRAIRLQELTHARGSFRQSDMLPGDEIRVILAATMDQKGEAMNSIVAKARQGRLKADGAIDYVADGIIKNGKLMHISLDLHRVNAESQLLRVADIAEHAGKLARDTMFNMSPVKTAFSAFERNIPDNSRVRLTSSGEGEQSPDIFNCAYIDITKVTKNTDEASDAEYNVLTVPHDLQVVGIFAGNGINLFSEPTVKKSDKSSRGKKK